MPSFLPSFLVSAMCLDTRQVAIMQHTPQHEPSPSDVSMQADEAEATGEACLMAEETLLSAARRALRFFRIDEAHGGPTSTDTLLAMDTLDKETERQRLAETLQEGEAH